ncbi:hypothetical protein HAP94_24950 [Acidithiobacillus ferrivorans]|nr:hypothetical protein [Acidithiobacillus ferrivorans]
MSSPHASMIGVYHCPPLYVAHETGTQLEAVEQAIRTLSDAGYCTFDMDSEYIFVHRMAAYQIGESLSAKDNRVSAVRKAVESLPDFSIKQMFIRQYAEAYHLQDLIDDSAMTPPNNPGGTFEGQLKPATGPSEAGSSGSGTPSTPLSSQFTGPSDPLSRPSKPPSEPLLSPFETPLDPLESPIGGGIFDFSPHSEGHSSPYEPPFDDIWSPLEAPLEVIRSPLGAPSEPLTSPSEASSSNSSSSSNSNSFPQRTENEAPIKISPGPRKRATGEDAPTTKTWNAYSQAYQRRYGTEPVRNQKVNSQLASFVKRLGQDESPAVAAFFVNHHGRFYVQGMHQVDLLLRDAEKLRTEWFTGQMPMNRHRPAPEIQHSLDPGITGHEMGTSPALRSSVVHL